MPEHSEEVLLAQLQQEAEKVYPCTEKEDIDDEYYYAIYADRIKLERAAYITGRQKSLARIKELEDEVSRLKEMNFRESIGNRGADDSD